MRGRSILALAALAGAVVLSAGSVRAATIDLYNINVDENGNGTYVEYAPPVVDPGNVIASGTLAWTPIEGGGIAYQLPYPINVDSNSTQWLGIFDSDGSTKSDLVHWTSTGVMSFYSNDNDGDVADVSPTDWATNIAPNWDGYSTIENPTSGIAYYSTQDDTGGVPGDPAVHPATEANYYFNSANSAVPEPASLGLLALGAVGCLARRRRA